MSPRIAALALGSVLLLPACPVPAKAAPAAEEAAGKASENRIRAQALVNEVMASRKDLAWVAIHGFSPAAGGYVILAHSKDKIGKKDDPNDIETVTAGTTRIMPNLALSQVAVMLPLKDAAGKIVGELGVAFVYRPGDDEALRLTQASAIRNELARRIPSHDSLFDPVRLGP